MKVVTESVLFAFGNTLFFIQRLAGSLTRMQREEQRSISCNSKQLFFFFFYLRARSVMCAIY